LVLVYGSFLGSITKTDLRLRRGFFHFALGYSSIYILIFFSFILVPGPSRSSLVVALHLLCMFCFFYIIYFFSKGLVLAEIGKPASFHNFPRRFDVRNVWPGLVVYLVACLLAGCLICFAALHVRRFIGLFVSHTR
jgi:hypothetical protein